MSNHTAIDHYQYRQNPDAWQTKVHSLLRLPFPLPWLVIAGVLFLAGYVVVRWSGEQTNALRFLAIQSALIAAIANSVVFYEKLLDDAAETFPQLLDEQDRAAKQWVGQWYDWTFWSRKNLLMGIALACVSVLCAGHSNTSLFTTAIGKGYSLFVTLVIGFLGGSMLWTMLGIARMISSLGHDVQIKLSIFDTSTSALRAASSVLWKTSLTASMVYILGISTYYLCSIQIDQSLLAIVLVFGIIILLYFILPQVNIHKTLVRIKRTKLHALVRQIDHTFDDVATAPGAENIRQLHDLFQLQDIVNGKKSWSFGVAELLMLIGSVLVPLVLFAAEHVLRR